MAKTIVSDTPKITFSVKATPTKYGDGRVFYNYRILMWSRGRIVGTETGPFRTHKTRAESRRAAWARVRELKTHDLFIIRVQEKDIAHGEAHSCTDCAIARALWRNMDRMGLDGTWDRVRVTPYGALCDVEGIYVKREGYERWEKSTGEDEMPDVVMQRDYFEQMETWARHFDEWAELKFRTLAEWREEHGEEDDYRPWRPYPCRFVLDMTALKNGATPAPEAPEAKKGGA